MSRTKLTSSLTRGGLAVPLLLGHLAQLPSDPSLCTAHAIAMCKPMHPRCDAVTEHTEQMEHSSCRATWLSDWSSQRWLEQQQHQHHAWCVHDKQPEGPMSR